MQMHSRNCDLTAGDERGTLALRLAMGHRVIRERAMSYRKHGGLHFIRIGRIGITFYLRKANKRVSECATATALEREIRDLVHTEFANGGQR